MHRAFSFIASVLLAALFPACGGGQVTPESSTNQNASGSNRRSAELPIPNLGPIPRPAGTGPSNFSILNWAGFKAAASYTFDDTQPSLFEHWDALKSTGVRMTIYANPTGNWFAGYDDTLKEALSLGFELGNHTMSHCHADLSDCAGQPPLEPVGTAEDEIDQCSEYLRGLGQPEVRTIAYPYGDVGWREVSTDRFLLGRGVRQGLVAPFDATDRYELPAVSARADDTTTTFTNALTEASIEGSWVIFLFHSLRPTTYDWYAGVDISAVTDSIAMAQASGDLWLDSLVNVGAYWLGQRLVRAAPVATEGSIERRTWTLPAHFPAGRYLRVVVDGGQLTQRGKPLTWDEHGYYEVALDVGEVTWSP